MLDSGTGQCVAAAKRFPEYEVQESEGSRKGRKFMLAGDHAIPNKGQMEIGMLTSEGQPVTMATQIADVGEPLWSVRQLVGSGNTVVFRKKGGYIANRATGLNTYFKERDGVYYIKMFVVGADEVKKWKSARVQDEPGFAGRRCEGQWTSRLTL